MSEETSRRRVSDRVFQLLGMTPKDWMQIGVVVFALMMAYTKFDLLVKSTDYLLGFAENSDRYHSSVLGVPFKQGEPARNNYDVSQVRSTLKIPIGEAK